MSFANPPMPPRMGELSNAVCDIYANVDGVGDGGVGVTTWPNLTHQGVICSLQEMSSSRALALGLSSEVGLFDLHMPRMRVNGTDIEIKGGNMAWQFEIDSTRYEAISGGVRELDGMQKIAVRRIGA